MRARALVLILFGLSSCGGRARKTAVVTDARPASTCGPAPAAGPSPRARQVVDRGHSGQIHGLAFSPDGRWLASASVDGSAKVWDVAARALLQTVRGPSSDLFPFVGWDGERLIFGREDAALYDVATGAEQARFGVEREAINGSKYRSEVRPLVPLPGGGYLGSDSGTVYQFDASRARVRKLAAHTSGTLAVAAGRAAWMTAWKELSVITLEETPAVLGKLTLAGDPRGFALSPDGTRLVLARAKGGSTDKASEIAIHDVANLTAAPVLVPDVPEYVQGVAISPDGRHLAAAAWQGLVVWDLAKREVGWRRAPGDVGSWGGFDRVTFSPDGRFVAAATHDARIFLFERETGRAIGELGQAIRGGASLAFLGEQRLIRAGHGHVTTWDLASARRDDAASIDVPELVSAHVAGADLITLRAGSFLDAIAAFDDECEPQHDSVPLYADRWTGGALPPGMTTLDPIDTDDAWPAGQRPWPPAPGIARRAHCVGERHSALSAVAPAGAVLVTLDDGQLSLVVERLDSGRRVTLDKTEGELLLRPQLSPSGRFAAATSGLYFGSAAIVWDATTGKRVHRLTVPSAMGEIAALVALSPDEARVAVSGGRQLAIHTLADGKREHLLELPAVITAITFAPGAVLVGMIDGSLARVIGGAVAATGASDGGRVWSIAASPGGTRAVSLGDDGALRVWDAHTATALATLLEMVDDEWLIATPAGAFTGTAEAGQRIGWVFDAPLEHFRFEQFASFRDPAVVKRRLAGGADLARTPSRPPRITAKLAETRGATARVTLTVASDSRVDVVRVYDEGRAVAEKPLCRDQGELGVDVPLSQGRNRITAVAFDAAGFSSNPAAVDAVSDAAGTRPDLWVVAVGVSRYPKLPARWQLQAADDDAIAIEARFRALAGPGQRYAAAHTTLLTDARATTTAIEAAVRGLAAMKPGDLAIVFFAGHGLKPAPDADMVFLTGAVSGLGDLARAGVGWQSIAAALAKAPGRVVVLLDACHAGHVSQDLIVPNNALAAALSAQGRAGVVVFAASKGRQLSWEADAARGLELIDAAPDDEEPITGAGVDRHGLFTGAWLDALGHAAADRDRDGALELDELIDAVTATVTRQSKGAQTPWVARRELFGDFAIAPTPATP